MLRKMLSRLSVSLASMIVLAAPGLTDPIDYDYLRARLDLLMESEGMMGLGVAVVENGEITFAEGFGLTEEGGQPVDAQTRFRWASVSKGLSGTLAAELEAEGQLSLSQTISSFRTTLKLPGLGEQSATLNDLLSHRLGIVSNAYDNILEGGKQPADIRGMLGDLKLICPIGECYNYQNVAFDAIAEIFQESTGFDFETLVQMKVFKPLGMSTASTTYDGLVDSGNYAKPYKLSGGRMRKDRITLPYFRVAAAGGVSSGVEDLARYMQAQMGRYPSVFSGQALKVAHTPMVKTSGQARSVGRTFERIKDADYALGWRVYDYDGRRVIGHGGMVRGYRSFIMFDPELKTGVAAMWNSNVKSPNGIQFEVMDMVYGYERRDWMRLLPLLAKLQAEAG